MNAVIIPARFQSVRFPGKLLKDLAGKSVIQRVFEKSMGSKEADLIIIATDDQRIFDHCQTFCNNVIMTSSEHTSGTDRCAEVCEKMEEVTKVVNVQGDEPFIQADQIDVCFQKLDNNKIVTLATKILSNSELTDSNVVKVICQKNGLAIYFSRNPIPFQRNIKLEEWYLNFNYKRHLGIYGFQADTLQKITKMNASSLEIAESLEQLRWIENGFDIMVMNTEHYSVGIDTPGDLEKAISKYK